MKKQIVILATIVMMSAGAAFAQEPVKPEVPPTQTEQPAETPSESEKPAEEAPAEEAPAEDAPAEESAQE